MQPPVAANMGIRRLGLADQPRAQAGAQPLGHVQQYPRRIADIAMQNRAHRAYAGIAALANSPGPNRAETCATSIRSASPAPSAACIADP